MRRAALLLPVVAAAALLTGCSGSGAGSPPDWQASPDNRAIEGPGAARVSPIVPLPSKRRQLPDTGGSAPQPSPSAPAKRGDPLVVATHLTAPVGLSLLPDGTALVGERTTGRIVQVQPKPHQPVRTIRTLRGLDAAGDGGLLDLAVSPAYPEDNLVYAYITTPTDNRVVEFTLHGPVTPVLTGIPKGPADNVGRIMFGADGDLYVGTGDADRSAGAERLTSLAGKVLRVTDIGHPAKGNPRRASPVWTSGHRMVQGLCTDGKDVFEVEAGPAGRPDEVNVLDRGDYYGWPTPRSIEHDPVTTLPAADGAPGGCALRGGRLWVTSLDGQALLSAPVGTNASDAVTLGPFTAVLHKRYGRLRTVVAAPDGALWLTTSNRDGHGHPVPTDERVIRYMPQGGSAGSRL